MARSQVLRGKDASVTTELVLEEESVRRFAKLLLASVDATLESELPWRKSENLWAKLVAEVLLQRVPVRRVLPVYEKILAVAPTPKAFLSTPEESVKALLKTLGLQNKKYDQLKEVAKALSEKNVSYLLSAKGFGSFGKAIVSLLAIGKKAVVVDEVVGRVVSRFLGLPKTKKRFVSDRKTWNALKVLEAELSVKDLTDLFFATVDVGRKWCKLKRPACSSCPLREGCSFASTCFLG